MYILDTNILIYFFKGLGNVAQKIMDTKPSEIAIPSIVIFELEYGIQRSSSPEKRLGQLADICSVIDILPLRENEALYSAKIRAELESKGMPIGPYDILIAGTAMANNGILVTNNTKEFNRVAGLPLENWY